MSIITVLSDVGTKDIYVPDIKTRLSGHVPFNNIIDISHAVAPSDIRHGAYLTLSTYQHFPAGSIHLLLVGIFNDNSQKLILAIHQGHYFLAPDNGILSLVFRDALGETMLCNELGPGATMKEWIAESGNVIAAIIAGQPLKQKYEAHTPYRVHTTLDPIVFNNRIDCSILHVDRFGNIVININRDQFSTLTDNKKFSIKILGVRDVIDTISQNYSDVELGKYLCRFNSSGFLEIAMNRSADGLEGKELPARNINYERVSININA